MTRQINHFGITCLMRPSVFLKLAFPLQPNQGKETVAYLVDQLRQGKQLGNPHLDVIVPNDDRHGNGVWQVKEHEGRHRMMAILEVHGDIPVEVQLFFKYGYRNSDIEPLWLTVRDVQDQRMSNVIRNAIERFLV